MAIAWPAVAAEEDGLSSILKRVEQRYNRARTIQVSFEQSYTAPGRARTTERGELYLRKPGRMRWDYTQPAGKLFLSDGKHIYFYSPSTNRAEKSKLKESEDLRAPLAFLLGKLDFSRDFDRYQYEKSGANTIVTAFPKNNRLPYTKVRFTVTPDYQISHLIVTGQDGSLNEFRFGLERINVLLKDSFFRFELPPGAQFVDATLTEGR
ncbi:MAG: outer membrane lipoprotein carrier protein LolA [Bryobacteraceae bacterium]|nr:outer membrane lipoprotein carrier protein LolA [Bryobacteraceae bacterium]